ncbi:hypothetical protein [Chryseobacterium sp. ERMR1:04]|uniref:hypothetical protein n=1 Tax=Chryseobacterium sp. ERMR1:04 TaxID=1705393 RepID=UPI0006C8CD1F|nr:hypothetical protein [Chryseobacterium sp. ERMR1:04]KPH13812.1 hypothetical protein AMQ68_09765 [Chryseobacterium sp. ERMR1:04]
MIKNFFDYHYYRIAKFYYKRDGSDATTALISVSSVQGWIIVNILLFIKEFFFETEKFKYGWIFFILIMVGIIFYNKNRYKDKYLQFRDKWINEKKREKAINGILVILTIIFAWSLIFINMIILNSVK